MEKIRVPEVKIADFVNAKETPFAIVCAVLALLVFLLSDLSMSAIICSALYFVFGVSTIGLLSSVLRRITEENLTRALETQTGLSHVTIIEGDDFVGKDREGKFISGHVTPDRNNTCIVVYN